ncbi:aaa family ATPase [Grosmannia clavigera kw1407]|uniref:Aaa family ATPase n=1 Tax=Grosmannia clavigera (strain kw1407 / UAMH 11150) TaxID=655863 RepID=F0XCD0_GROCL|nr:aaa family ATPase [Grosmannia clavigera kw1407]EFX04252.1 aaa family ATPase [Grosmannia clavigera kw1407]
MASEKTDSRFSVLEQKYIDLLERRVQDLERKLAGAEGSKQVNGTASSNSKKAEKLEKEEDESSDSESVSEGETKDDEDKEKDKEPDDDRRYRVVISEYDPNTGEYVERANESLVKPTTKPKNSKRAFTFQKNRRLGAIAGNESRNSEVDIESSPLQQLLARVMSKLDAGKSKVADMSSPYQDLIWCWKEAEEMAATSAELEEATKTDFKDVGGEEKQARLDLRALLNIISTSSGDEALDTYFKSKDDMKDSRTISFSALWTLFPPGSFIIARPFLNHEQVFLVQSCEIPDTNDNDAKLSVTAFSYDWNGNNFHRVPYRFIIEEFKDKKTISQLDFYPLKYYSEGDEAGNEPQEKSVENITKDVEKLKVKLIQRGKKFVEYSTAEKGKKTFNYDGRAFYTSNHGLFRPISTADPGDSDTASTAGTTNYASSDSQTAGTTNHIKGTVVVDFKSYLEYQPESAERLGSMAPIGSSVTCSCGECRARFEALYRYSWDKAKKETALSDDQYMMLPPRVLGYSLEQKRWVHLDIDRLKQLAKADSKNFDEKLMLHDDNKKLIKNSVKAHGSQNVVDYTPNKGKGLILLLWGVPGVGKTLTAESVAMLAGKPLFSIGVSDIGTESSMVEANLQRVFSLAGLWEAVLLLYVMANRLFIFGATTNEKNSDEADVFLEDRSSQGSNIHRNTMVSVLLRILEYYEGILILTTNRVRTFDIAVQSRIHIAIEYKELSDDQRENIFIDFLNQLVRMDIVQDWNAIKEWVHQEGRIKQFNGRQIRNTVYTAMGMAHAEARKLERADLVTVARNTEAFKKVLSDNEAVYRSRQIF